MISDEKSSLNCCTCASESLKVYPGVDNRLHRFNCPQAVGNQRDYEEEN